MSSSYDRLKTVKFWHFAQSGPSSEIHSQMSLSVSEVKEVKGTALLVAGLAQSTECHVSITSISSHSICCSLFLSFAPSTSILTNAFHLPLSASVEILYILHVPYIWYQCQYDVHSMCKIYSVDRLRPTL